MTLTIRKMELRDFTSVISLIKNEMGCGGISSDIYDRIMRIYQDDSYALFVADMDDKVIGFVGIMRGLTFELDGEYVRIIALAVKSEYQNQGVGTRLAERAEDYAYELGASSMVLTSGLRCSDAHLFYESMGYFNKGYSLVKKLSRGNSRSIMSAADEVFAPIPPRHAYDED